LQIVNTYNVDQLKWALDSLGEWAKIWQLPVADNKCYTLQTGTVSVSRQLCINGVFCRPQ